MSDRDLFLKVTAEGGPQLNDIFEKLKAIGGMSKATAKDIGTFEAALKANVFSTREYNGALEAVARNEKRAADELQRYGQMQARAEADDRRRTAAIQAKTRALEQAAKAENLSAARGISSLGSFAGIAPGGIGGGITGVSSLLNSGLSGGVVAATAGVGAFALLTGAVIKAANSLGDYAREQQNVAARTGLSVTETQLFGRVAEVAGVNAGTLTTSMRTLSKAMAENTAEGKLGKQALKELGLDSSIAFDGTESAIRKIFAALGSVDNALERDRLAIALFGRGALELAPLFGKFEELSAQVKATGVIIDKEGIEKAAEYRRQAALLGDEWDAVVLKFKQKAVGIVSFIIGGAENAPGAGGPGTGTYRGLVFNKDFSPEELQKGGPLALRQPLSPEAATGLVNQQALQGMRDRVGTPKDRIEARIKQIQSDIATAEQKFANNAPGSAEQTKAAQDFTSQNAKLAAARAELEALKDGKRASEETLRLREQLIAAGARELSGVVKINAEYEKEVLHLKDKKEATPENLSLAARIRDTNLATFRQQAAIAATEDQRRVRDADLSVQAQIVRSTTGKQAQLAKQTATLSGDEQGGILADYTDRVEAARQEYEFSKQRSDINRADAAQEFALKSNSIAFGKAITAADIADIQAKGKLEIDLDNAKLQRQILLAALAEKDRKDEEKAAEEEIKRQQILSDLTLKRSRTIAEGQTRLSVVNAPQGFELQAELNADAARLALDRQQAILNQARSQASIDRISALRTNDPAHDKELNKEIADIRLQAAREASQIENDTIKSRYDAEVRIAEKRKADEEAFKSTVVGFLNATQQGKGQEFLRGVGQGLLNTVEGNVAGLAFKPASQLAGSIGQRLSGTADDPTFVGKLLAGTPFGPQARNPIDKNTTSIDLLTKAVDRNTATQTAIVTGQPLPTGGVAIPGFGGSGGLSIPGIPGLGGGLSTFGSDIGGFTGSGPLGSLVKLFGGSSTAPSVTSDELSNLGVFTPAGGGPSSRATSSSTQSFGGLSGFANGLGSANIEGVATGVQAAPGGGSESVSTSERIGGAAAIGAVAYAGTTAAIKQFQRGGAYGAIGGIGTLAGTAAVIDPEPISKAVLTGVALTSKLITAIMGDPRQHRQDQVNMELAHNVYQAPTTQNRTQDIYGNYTDYDKYGKLQTSDFSAIPQVSQPYITKRNGQYFDVPGQVTSPFGGGGQPQVIQYNSFQSIDPGAAMNYFKSNPDVANGIVHVGLTQATGPAQGAVRETAGLS